MDIVDQDNQLRNMGGLTEDIDSIGSSSRNKRQKSTYSDVWNYFEKHVTKEGEKRTCFCKKCNRKYIWGGAYGTKNLLNHIEKCPLLDVSTEINQRSEFDQKKYRELMARAIIQHNLPFKFVQYDTIREIHSYLNNRVEHYSRNTSRSDVMKVYENERVKLKEFMKSCSGRVSLTSDLWTSVNTDGYITLTAHFIDNEWNLQKKLLNFCLMTPPHSGSAIFGKISTMLSDWEIVDKIFACTLDNASANDKFVESLKSHLTHRKALVADGQFLHVRCAAHVLNLVVQDGLKCVSSFLSNIRESIKFIKGSQSRKKSFVECIATLSLDGNRKGLRQDVPTIWNSTFIMLKSAIHYEQALYRLKLIDSSYTYFPTSEEWIKAKKISRLLEVFYDATCLFSGTSYPTANLFFPKIFLVHYTLKKCVEEDDFISHMATEMLKKFNKYWSEFSELLSIACIFDPRYKTNFNRFSYDTLYGDCLEFVKVKKKLEAMYDEYVEMMRKESSTETSVVKTVESTQSFTGPYSQECENMMDQFDFSEFASNPHKSELDSYLEDGLVDRKMKLDILLFWKSQQYKYPVLSLMARDILAVPITTVASESAFSISGRVLDDYRSSLKEDVVEALLCSRDWLYGTPIMSTIEDSTEDITVVLGNEQVT